MDQLAAQSSQSKVSTEHSPWQVSQLSRSLKDWIEKLGRVWVEGELQSFSEKGGNIFGSLRDLDIESAIEIHAFANSDAEIEAGLKQGDRVVALLQPVFWPKNGKLTMRIGAMHKVGLGELLERIERLKQQLIAEGLTDPVRKKPLPFLPNKIGLVTGAKSDAEKDILQIAKSRWPDVQFEVAHTLVQGDRAAAEIIMALGQLDAMPDVDVIIVARGGGSFQDLLPFSDERLVREAAGLSKPLVSAIGHENDSPLLDLVADLRASTPTDAAKRVVPDVIEERRNMKLMRERAWYRVSSYVDAQLQLISSIRTRPVLASPFGFIDAQTEQLSLLTRRIREIFDYRLKVAVAEVRELKAGAAALSPKLTFERGYSVLLDAAGKRVSKLKAGSKFTVITKDQEISGSTESVKERDV